MPGLPNHEGSESVRNTRFRKPTLIAITLLLALAAVAMQTAPDVVAAGQTDDGTQPTRTLGGYCTCVCTAPPFLTLEDLPPSPTGDCSYYNYQPCYGYNPYPPGQTTGYYRNCM